MWMLLLSSFLLLGCSGILGSREEEGGQGGGRDPVQNHYLACTVDGANVLSLQKPVASRFLVLLGCLCSSAWTLVLSWAEPFFIMEETVCRGKGLLENNCSSHLGPSGWTWREKTWALVFCLLCGFGYITHHLCTQFPPLPNGENNKASERCHGDDVRGYVYVICIL